MVDLSAVVFLIYLGLVLLKWVAPWITTSGTYQRLSALFQRNTGTISGVVATGGLVLVLVALVLGGIHRILLFAGFVLLVIAFVFRKLNAGPEGDAEGRRLPFEVISLGGGVFLVLVMMWYLGADMFSGF